MDSITLSRPGTTIQLRKRETPRGSRWWVVAPLEHPADREATEALTGTLASLRSLRTVAENPDRLTQFGLEAPRMTIRFTAGDQSGSLALGDTLPTEDGFYVRSRGDTRVQIISDLDWDNLNQDLNELRRKRLFTLALDDVDRFVITRGSKTWQLVAEDDKWSLEDAPGFPVNSQKVNSILIRFTRGEAASFVDEPLHPRSWYGLASPPITVTLSDGKVTETLLLGKPADGTGLYAQRREWSQVMTVPKDLVEVLPAHRDELREEKVDPGKNP
jgi:hypothetical protein